MARGRRCNVCVRRSAVCHILSCYFVLNTPAGSVSIGGMQALIAGVAMPSGWQLLGQTPLATYDPQRDPPFLIAPGDEVHFHPVNATEFKRLEKAAAKGKWAAEKVSLSEGADSHE